MTVTLLGGEMLHWSDLDGRHGPPPAGGAALRTLLAAAGGHALVAGPHDPSLVDALPARRITLLVRGRADAEALADRYEGRASAGGPSAGCASVGGASAGGSSAGGASVGGASVGGASVGGASVGGPSAGRPEITVCCGSLEKIAAEPAYDWVVALDGLDRLASAEAVEVSWAESLARLAATLRPGGRLLLGMENPFGLHRLVAVPGPPRDSEWVTFDDHEPGRLRGRVERAGLRVLREYAAYPGPGSPSVLAGSDLVADPSLAGFLEATVCRTWQHDGPVLADPARLVRGAFRSGLGAELAPAWVVVAELSDSVQVVEADSAPAAGGHSAPGTGVASVPGAGVASVPGAGVASVPGAGVASVPGAAAAWSDAVVGEALFDAAELPRGRTLEDLLAAAARRRDQPAMRELIASWQDGVVAGVPAGQIVVSDRLVALTRPGEPTLALRMLAASMIEQGLGHLWPAPADEASLAALLAGMAGRELDPAAVPDLPRGAVPAVRELMMARERLERELVEVRAKRNWYERRLSSRDAELKRERRINAILSATVPGRVANRVLGGLRAVRRVIRRARG